MLDCQRYRVSCTPAFGRVCVFGTIAPATATLAAATDASISTKRVDVGEEAGAMLGVPIVGQGQKATHC